VGGQIFKQTTSLQLVKQKLLKIKATYFEHQIWIHSFKVYLLNEKIFKIIHENNKEIML